MPTASRRTAFASVSSVQAGSVRSGRRSRSATAGIGDRADREELLGRRAEPAPLQYLTVRTGTAAYEVAVGPGAVELIREVLPAAARRAVVVVDAGALRALGEGLRARLDPGVPHELVVPGGGEALKRLSVVEELCRAFAHAGLARSDVVVAVGGGALLDASGLAAALYHRGIAYVNVPTTLLAQVDASVGGKTAVNLPEGKNLVGAFWQPHAVLCDTDLLATLPAEERASGMGEVAKCALIRTPFWPALGKGLLAEPLERQVRAALELKAQVVARDPLEQDARAGRAVLNYGHTLAHALEACGLAGEGAALRHGEAVAIGLVFAARLAARLGRIGPERVEEHVAVVTEAGLPTSLPKGASARELRSRMAYDKKARGGLRFVLDGPEGLELVEVPDAVVLEELVAFGAAPELAGGRR
jgi:5-deoxy-5-amino-3-dehydroquinate synthase